MAWELSSHVNADILGFDFWLASRLVDEPSLLVSLPHHNNVALMSFPPQETVPKVDTKSGDTDTLYMVSNNIQVKKLITILIGRGKR